MSSEKSVLVIGGTGNQGGATARALLSRGWDVRALVRDPDKPGARELREQGAVLVAGDMDDEASLHRAMAGVHGVFSVQALAYEPATLAAEVRQGKTVADAAKSAGVGHFVYSSVGGAERRTGIDHFETKARVERHIVALGLPATILRPAFFMNNLLHYADARSERLMALPVRPDKPMQMVAADDIGVFAALAFGDPQTYVGRQIELAGDEVTFPEIARIYERVTGVPTRLDVLPIEERMFEWFAEEGYQADIPALRGLHPELMTFEEFLVRQLQTTTA
ncbi:NmrA/HSCARG family protein [Streptomyces sp. NPDC051218]|uniref:NmrA/HSCARG family protein n=1 Tax=Streptomyces sp. NPDC051218 TaxID=3365645 RepID=UPI00378A4938